MLGVALYNRAMDNVSAQSLAVVVADHDAAWATQFLAVEALIRRQVGDAVTAVDHIGSTSVPGLAAKPVIDVLVRVIDLDRIDARFDDAMAAVGFASRGEFAISGRRFYVRPADGQHLRTHVHLVPLWHRAAGDHLRFRDYLRVNDQLASRYGLLKRQLAQAYPDDIDTYMSGKADLMHRISGEARHYYANR